MTVTLSGALGMISAAQKRARELKVAVSVAVVDAGGNLVAFQRMDTAEIAGQTLAIDKAFTAVAHRIPTSDLAVLAAPGGELYGLAANGSGRYVIFGGGIPIVVDDVVVGAIGVGGASTRDDADCASAGIEAGRGLRR